MKTKEYYLQTLLNVGSHIIKYHNDRYHVTIPSSGAGGRGSTLEEASEKCLVCHQRRLEQQLKKQKLKKQKLL